VKTAVVSEAARANAPPAVQEWFRGVVAALKRYSNVHRGKGQNSTDFNGTV